MLTTLLQTTSLTMPVFLILFLGMFLKRIDIIDTTFINSASNFIFKVTMPMTVGMSLIKADLKQDINLSVLLYFSIATILAFAFCWLVAIWKVKKEDIAVFVQGSFRGNNGTIGLALAASIYGDYGLALGGALAALVIIYYNSLCIFILTYYSDAKTTFAGVMKSIVKNPLMIGTVLALIISLSEIKLYNWLLASGNYLAQITLPLAVLCIGGSLSLRELSGANNTALLASFLKTVFLPILITIGAYFWGFRKEDLAILFLYACTPAASVSFIMAKAYNANAKLAATIIAITSFVVIITCNVGLFILQYLGLI